MVTSEDWLLWLKCKRRLLIAAKQAKGLYAVHCLIRAIQTRRDDA